MLLRLELVSRELERPTILGHRAHHLLRRARRNARVDLEHNLDFRPDDAREMGDDFLSNPPGVASYSRAIERDCGVKASGLLSRRRSGARGRGGRITDRVLTAAGCRRRPGIGPRLTLKLLAHDG